MATALTLLARLGIDTSEFDKGLAGAEKRASGLSQSLQGIGRSVTGLGTSLTTAVTLPLVAAGAGALKAAADFEQTQVAFTTMLGDADAARAMLNDLANFAAKTPFQLTDVEQGAKQLLAMGSSVEEVIPELKALGDVSAGLNVPMDRLILNYGQVRLQGKLTGRELRDFAVSGVPIIAELAKNLNVSEEAIADMVSRGEIGFSDVEKAFQTMTSEGGKFNNLMDEQSKTVAGQFSNLKDTLNLLARDIGSVLLPIAKDIVTTLQGWVQWIKDLSPEQKRLILIIGGVAAAIGPLLVVVGAVISGIGALLTPIGLVFGGIILAIGLLAAAWLTNFGGIQEKVAAVWAVIQPVFQAIVSWFQSQIPIAIQFLSGLWSGVLVPALEVVGEFIANTLVPIFMTIWDVIQNTIPVAIQILSDAWNNILLPVIEIVVGFLQEYVFPILAILWSWLQDALPVAVQFLADIWNNILLPAITAIWGFLNRYIFPIFVSLVNLLGKVLGVAITVLAGLWQNVLWPAIQKVWEIISTKLWPIVQDVAAFFGRVFEPAIRGIGSAFDFVKGIIDKVSDGLDWIGDHLPDWLTPGSPTPFEIGLLGIANAMNKINRIGLPSVTTSMATPAVAGISGGGMTQVNLTYAPGISLATEQEADRVLRPFIERGVRDANRSRR